MTVSSVVRASADALLGRQPPSESRPATLEATAWTLAQLTSLSASLWMAKPLPLVRTPLCLAASSALASGLPHPLWHPNEHLCLCVHRQRS